MNFIRTLISELWNDKSLVRIYLNERLRKETLSGRTLDIGCGSNMKYLDFMMRAPDTQMEVLDPKIAKTIDFESDALPYATGTFNTVILLNVLEHVFHYQHLVSEVHRTLSLDGRLIGFTPFLVRYHPDPHDFFRYTDEALRKILEAQGFKNIEVVPIGAGPFLAGLNVFVLSLPRPIRVLLSLKALACDYLFLKVRPQARAIYPMGYCFFATK